MLGRSHWSIENQLYWNLDVNACRAKKKYTAQNLSAIRNQALLVIKGQNDKRSIRKRHFRASLSQDYLLELLLSTHI